MHQPTKQRERTTPAALTLPAIAFLLLLAICIALIRPFVEAGISDDFSFIRSAKDFADHGRFIYNGWSSPILGWMLPFGALFIKLFGFSFTHVRIASFVITAANGLLVQWILLRAGSTRWLALLASTAIIFSPISLPETVVFFTDQPGLFALLITFALCLRILRAETPRATRLWILLAFFASVFLGTARQLLWMCVFVMIPSAVFLVRKRRGVLPFAAACFVLACASIAAILHWWNRQPYALNEPLLQHYPLSAWARYLILPAMELLVLLAPIMSLLLLRRVSFRQHAIEAAIALVTLLLLSQNPYNLLHVASNDIFGGAPRWIFLLAAGYAFALTARVIRLAFNANIPARPRRDHTFVSLYELSVLVAPFVAALFILTITRETFFARYLLPVFAALTLWLVKLWQDTPRRALHSIIPAALLVLFAAFSIIQTHDLFRGIDAVLSMTRWYAAQGLPRNQLEAGFSFDGWYQIDQTGYINEPRIKVPAGAFVPHWLPPGTAICHNFFLPDTPSIHPVYGIGEPLNQCFTGPVLHTVTYTTWQAPHQHTMLLKRFAPPYALPQR